MLNQITQIRMPDGKTLAIVDWSDKPLYSACDLGNGFTAETVDLFQTVVGRPVPTAARTAGGPITARTNTLADTNISTQGGLSSTEEALVYAIRPDVQEYGFGPNDFTSRSVTDANSPAFAPAPQLGVLAVLNAALLIELEVTQKIFPQAGFGWFNAGFGASAGVTTAPAFGAGAGITPANAGFPSDQAVRKLTIPVHIGGQEKFRLRLRNPGAQAVNFACSEASPPVANNNRMVTIRVYLDTLYKRPTT